MMPQHSVHDKDTLFRIIPRQSLNSPLENSIPVHKFGSFTISIENAVDSVGR